MSTASDTLTRSLDDLERRLPAVPSQALEFTRAGVRRVNSTVASVADHVGRRFGVVGDQVGTAARTAAGQTTSAAGRVVDTATASTKEAAGQIRAQSGAAVDAVEAETAGALQDGTTALDPDQPLGELTKSELYELAQQRDVDGRSSMSKRQLIAALRRTG